jgi:predicted CXXCH cytochrome family protein
VVLFIAVALGFAATVWFWEESSPGKPNESTARFAGSASCKGCHPAQYSQWLESNHRHAMDVPSAETVLGDFNNSEFRYFGRTTRFYKDGDSFRIITDNPQGQPETFRIAYTLGYKPLQQYLVDVGGGRIQVLPFAWDTRDRKDGGQRWFSLYPKDNVAPANPLFWTRPMQNWNHMCGDCHTTGFSKNFSDGSNTFSSRWSETANGCESCHGAGSAHVEARKIDKNKTADDSLIASLRTPKAQIDQCGACHARRIRLRERSSRERMLETMLDTWRPQLPQDGLYFVDGQIREEAFEIGSFLQSRMAAKGVRCTDCHDPHTARLKAEGNALCTQCHVVEKFDREEHYFHKPGTSGAQCVNCHMPARTYMIVDSRRDHRLAIPRPDLSDSLATPNPCTGCHTDRTNSWAAEAIRKQKGSANSRMETWGVAAWEAVQERRSATEILAGLPASANPISKAAVLASLKTITPEALGMLVSQRSAAEPLVRLGTVEAIGKVLLSQRVPLLMDMVRDSSLAIRLEAASLLAGTDKTTLSAEQRTSLDAALAEYRNWLKQDADRAESMAALAALQAAEGDVVSAQASFEKALQRDETSLTVLLNYADFYRAQSNDTAAEPLLSRAAMFYPDSANVHFALGLLRVRQKRTPEAVPELALAARLSPDDGNFAYVYAVSLYTIGQKDVALSVLNKARTRFPANAEISSALQAYCAEYKSLDRQIAAVCSATIPKK